MASVTVLGHTIPKGFTSDFATIPRIAWTAIGYHPFSEEVRKASLLHDFLISTGKAGGKTDRLFRQQLINDGVPARKAKFMCWCVRKYRQITGYDKK